MDRCEKPHLATRPIICIGRNKTMQMRKSALKNAKVNTIEKEKYKITNGSVFTGLLSAYSGWSSYTDSRDEGNGVIKSAALAAKDLVLPELMGGMGYLAYSALPGAVSMGISAYENINMQIRRNQRSNQTPFSNYTFRDSEALQQMRASSLALAEQAVNGSFTTRQRGIAAAQKSQFAGMGYGNEASDIYR